MILSGVHVSICVLHYVYFLWIDARDGGSGVFFFQAEDGIRDLVRSRGLGDVYKRQCVLTVEAAAGKKIKTIEGMAHRLQDVWVEQSVPPVSYTHLTLPTSDLV